MTDFQASTADRREGERRALLTQPMQQEQSGWHLDKKVPLGLIFTILLQAGMVIWAIADIKKDVELLKQDAASLHVRDSQQADSFREALKMMQDQFMRMDSKLDRLIERNGK
jgi:hypothetical protein